ncbi:MAG: gamma-glutamylcyclotransferase [Candidatus Omnitrophica bacterium]|nr:gamma-glutamylcyclotransferase [Candidatus Omnitrophota bacterium]
MREGKMDGVYYFTYSQHMDSSYLKRLQITYSAPIPAFLPDYRLVFNVLEDELFRFEKRGLANIVPARGNRVEGVLYEIAEDDFLKLDEDIGVPDMKYYRKLVFACSCSGRRISAMTYAGWPDVTAYGLLPSHDYLKKIIQAARQSKVPSEFRHWLESHPTTI